MPILFLLSQTGNWVHFVAWSLSKMGKFPSPVGSGHRASALQNEERRFPLSVIQRPWAGRIHTQGQVKRASMSLKIPTEKLLRLSGQQKESGQGEDIHLKAWHKKTLGWEREVKYKGKLTNQRQANLSRKWMEERPWRGADRECDLRPAQSSAAPRRELTQRLETRDGRARKMPPCVAPHSWSEASLGLWT